MTEFQAVLIAGPTASGKSARAMELAREMNGVIINADSMAVYQDLPILSARPPPEDIAATPHLLFGHIGAERNYSVGQWLADAALALQQARAENRTPLFVGGTGIVVELEKGTLLARIYPIDKTASTEFWDADGRTRSAIDLTVRDWSSLTVTDLSTGASVPTSKARFATEFRLVPGHSYRVE